MKIQPSLTIFILFAILCGTACNKTRLYPVSDNSRTIKYVLYTNKDFSDNSNNIKFSLFMRSHTKVLLDTELATMKIKEIPNADNKIIIEKTVPGNDNSDISVGFHYSIEGVGNSQHLDSIRAGETFKVVDFAFQ
jgi:hypothetical protein